MKGGVGKVKMSLHVVATIKNLRIVRLLWIVPFLVAG